MIGSEAMSALNRAISALQKGDLLTASSLAAKLSVLFLRHALAALLDDGTHGTSSGGLGQSVA